VKQILTQAWYMGPGQSGVIINGSESVYQLQTQNKNQPTKQTNKKQKNQQTWLQYFV
jgi:hypothetical protein